MQFGILYSYWSREWACDLEGYAKIIKKVSDLGFDILEINAHHVYEMSQDELRKLNALAQERGITFTTNSGPAEQYDLASPDPAVRKQGIQYFNTILEKMQLIQAKVLVGAIYSHWPCNFKETDKQAAWERSISCLQEIGRTAEGLGMEIALEVLNRNETYILTTADEAVEYCQRVGSPSVKILLDTYHMNIEEDDLQAAIQQAGGLLGHVHVGECNRKLPGMNNSIDWAGLGQALRAVGYEGAVVMEPFMLPGGSVGDSIRVWRDLSGGAGEEQLDRYAAQSLTFLKEKLL